MYIYLVNLRMYLLCNNCIHELEALREHIPLWYQQIITPVLSIVSCVSRDVNLTSGNIVTNINYALHCFVGQMLTPKVLDHYLHHDLVMLQLLCFLLTYSS